MSMTSWNLRVSAAGGGLADWFLTRLATARRLIPDAGFDTILPDGGEDFGQLATTELVDTSGTTSLTADETSTGGVATVSVENGSGRMVPKDAGSHIKDATLESWYAASLFKYTQPLDETQLANTRADAIGLFQDPDNYVALGVFGDGSGGSLTTWEGSVDKDASILAVDGPSLDGVESPVWHLAEMWFDVDEGKLHFALDGAEFDDTIDVADMPTGEMTLSDVVRRDAAGDPALLNVDKWCVIVKSPTVGDP